MKRRWLLLGAAVFVVVEGLAILYALMPALTGKPQERRPEIRLGVVSIAPLGRAEEEWISFSKSFGDAYKCNLRPYFANSEEEAAAGLLNGSLDVVYLDAASYLELSNKAKLKIWLYHRLSKKEKERMRAVLACAKPVSYISDTKGMRLCLSQANPMTGRAVPTRYLEEKLPCKIKDWFSSVATAPSEAAAFAMMLAGETDVVACSDISLDSLAERSDVKPDALKRLWLSMTLPENSICSLESLNESSASCFKEAAERIKAKKLQEEFLSARSMIFLPPDYSFNDAMNGLQRFLEGPRAAKLKLPISSGGAPSSPTKTESH